MGAFYASELYLVIIIHHFTKNRYIIYSFFGETASFSIFLKTKAEAVSDAAPLLLATHQY
jgi:hypothetical protein